MDTTARDRRIKKLSKSGSEWDQLTAEYMAADPAMRLGDARPRAFRFLVDQREQVWRERTKEAPRPIHWGDDPKTLAIVGLN